jgi:ribosomal protein S18 acetylase RimI-like enzyme
MEIIQARTEVQINQARELFREYERWLDVGLCFQNFEKELAELLGGYAPPTGRLLLAAQGDQVAGCVALRRLSEGVCEMKRLFVRPQFQGKRFGQRLLHSIIDEARTIGYQRMRLDTLPDKMERAIALYRSAGFQQIAPYYHHPIAGALYMELDLTSRA